MKVQDTKFHFDMWNNYLGIQAVLEGKEDLHKIEEDSLNPTFLQTPCISHPTHGLKIFVLSMTAPLKGIFAVFLRSIAFVLYYTPFPCPYRLLHVCAEHINRDWKKLGTEFQFAPCIVSASGHHQISSVDAYGTSDTRLCDVEDPWVKELTYYQGNYKKGLQIAMEKFYTYLHKKYSFFNLLLSGVILTRKEKQETCFRFAHLYQKAPSEAFQLLINRYSYAIIEKPLQKLFEELKKLDRTLGSKNQALSLYFEEGMSRGASTWFINLYLKTHHRFDKTSKHLESVGKIFESGVPKQGAIAQVFQSPEHLLKIKKNVDKKKEISLLELEYFHAKVNEKIGALSKGIYRVDMGKESLVFVKRDNQECYIWNPHLGLYRMDEENFISMILKYHYRKDNPFTHIDLFPYELDLKGEKMKMTT